MRRLQFILILLISISITSDNISSQHLYNNRSEPRPSEEDVIYNFYVFLSDNTDLKKDALSFLEDSWQDEYIYPCLELIYLTADSWNSKNIFDLLYKMTDSKLDRNVYQWLEWMWDNDQLILPFHDNLMATIYRIIDPHFELYFKNRRNQALIRWDEIRWGGVQQDGIPPLRNPQMLSIAEAEYLDDDNIVFGIEINGDSRAYPNRILAWHEMFVDEVGGVNVAGVYCTLCGTVIIYETDHNGVEHNMGTSGFLYRSNKLMYDKATQSLWNTIEGKPVIGPLVSKGIELRTRSVVTTTWGEWKKTHPQTKVLSINTGHRRDYGEGVAYKDYFSTDRLMFNVPKLDTRLKNKDEVFIIRADGFRTDPLAIYSKFLYKNQVYIDSISGRRLIVITDNSGASRAYDIKDITFKSQYSDMKIEDSKGKIWKIREEGLINEEGDILLRLPSHRIFWFAWVNSYPDTRLIK